MLHRMSASLNNSIKYNFIILTFTKILYDFRTREIFDLLRLEDFDVEVLITRFSDQSENVIIAVYLIIKSVIKTQ